MNHPLLTPAGQEALAAAAAEPDVGSFAAGNRLRERFGPELAAASLGQVELRRRGVAKLGEAAHELYLTRDGLEQASRPEVAAWRAARLAASGVREVWDLGCGIGSDARALLAAGLEVVAVERDEATAALAAANLPGARVVCADATTVDVPRGAAVFLDPARRDGRGRVWSLAGLSPSWDFTVSKLRAHGGAVKVGPGLAHREIPDDLAAEWVSHRGDVVECSLWTDEPGGRRAATLLPGGGRLVADDSPTPTPTGPRAFVGEPDGAALRAGCLPRLARELDATLVASGIAYLAADAPAPSPWVTWFEVVELLPFKPKELRRWVAERAIGTLEIKKRGVDVDPAALRRSLKPAGDAAATLMISPTPVGVRAMVVRRVQP